MSSHADTIRKAIWGDGNAEDSLDALLAENQRLQHIIDVELADVNRRFSEKRADNQRLREALLRIADLTGADYSTIMRRIAHQALAGDAE